MITYHLPLSGFKQLHIRLWTWKMTRTLPEVVREHTKCTKDSTDKRPRGMKVKDVLGESQVIGYNWNTGYVKEYLDVRL